MDWGFAATIVVPICGVIGYSVKCLNGRLKGIEKDIGAVKTRLSVIETILQSMGWNGGFPGTGTERE